MDWTALLNDVVVPIILALIGTFGTAAVGLLAMYLKKKIAESNMTAAEKEALGYLVEGVEKTGEDFVHLAKTANEDGKLSVEERAKARDLAIEHAKKIATGKGAAVLATWSAEKAGAYIKQIIKSQRKSVTVGA